MPTSQDLWLVLNGGDPRRGVAALADEAARWKQAFHWRQAFPQVKARGGFAALLGNPPWERIKLQAEELFASRRWRREHLRAVRGDLRATRLV